jgi:predicted dehydrogenase
MSQVNRRKFLRVSAASAAFVSAASYARTAGANERINIGVVGTGGRGSYLTREAIKCQQNIVAICDVAPFRLEKFSKLVTDAKQEKPSQSGDYRKLLEYKNLDAVIIATPDHHHRDVLLATMQADKDAYCEKPLSKTLEEGREMVKAVRATKKIVQVGNQRHSGPHWKKARDVVQSKEFGDIVWVKVWDCRNWVQRDPFAPPKDFDQKMQDAIDWKSFLGKAPKRDFDATRYFSWRWYWDYAGGLMTDIGAHQIDIVQWLGGVDAPKSVVANGGVYHFKHWETPDVVHGIWDYGKFVATFAVEFVNGADGVGCAFYGTKQTLIADADKEIRIYNTADKITPEMKPLDAWSSRNESDLHVINWLECVKSRKEPNSPIELGHRVITAAHLANMSYRTGKKMFWDAEKEKATQG